MREMSEDEREDYHFENAMSRHERMLSRSTCPDCRGSGGTHHGNCPNDDGAPEEHDDE